MKITVDYQEINAVEKTGDTFPGVTTASETRTDSSELHGIIVCLRWPSRAELLEIKKLSHYKRLVSLSHAETHVKYVAICKL